MSITFGFSLSISEEVLNREVTATWLWLLVVGSRDLNVLLVAQPIAFLKAGYCSLDTV